MKNLSEIIEQTRAKAFVIYRNPHENPFHLITIDPKHIRKTEKIEEAGYYLAPFDLKKHTVILFPETKTEHHIIDQPAWVNPNNRLIFNKPNPQQHIRKVNKAIDIIRNGEIQKIVISSAFTAKILQFDPWNTYFKIASAYLGSYVYYWHWPGHFSMLGATPEVLLQYQGNQGLVYSLAGTKFVEEKRQWTAKEIEEQDLVTQFIKNKLLAWQYPFSIDGPYEIRQGHLIHLRTDFQFLFNPDRKTLSKIIKGLHPTPAVAGLPKTKAIRHIREIEGYDRAFYTGFTGHLSPVNGKLFVNLRNMKISENRLQLYAGGGITKDSQPEQEWREVVRKTDILKQNLI